MSYETIKWIQGDKKMVFQRSLFVIFLPPTCRGRRGGGYSGSGTTPNTGWGYCSGSETTPNTGWGYCSGSGTTPNTGWGYYSGSGTTPNTGEVILGLGRPRVPGSFKNTSLSGSRARPWAGQNLSLFIKRALPFLISCIIHEILVPLLGTIKRWKCSGMITKPNNDIFPLLR